MLKKLFKDSDLPYLLLYVLLVHVFFYRFFVPGQMVFGTDTISQSYPTQVVFMREIFKNHSLPLWNPYIFSGMPLLASFSFHILYPLNWIYFFLSTEFAMGYQYVIHFILMGITFYYFARQLKLSREASFVGGLLFVFNAHFVSLIYPGHGGKLFTIAYLPLALMLLDRAMDGRAFLNLTLMGLVVGLMFYGGHIQILFYCGITLLLFLVMRIALGLKERGAKWALRGAAGFAYAFGLGTLLYAAVLLPAWEYKGFTERGGGGVTQASSYEFAVSFSNPPEDMLYLALRDPFGWGKDYGPTEPTTSGIFYRGRIGLRLSVDYVGMLGLALALAGLIFRRNRYTWFFAGLAAFTAFLALGGFNPFYYYVWKYVPGFSIFRIPYAVMILMPISFCVPAAFGMQYLLDGAGLQAKGKKKKADGFLRFIYAGFALSAVSLAFALFAKAAPDAVGRWFLGFDTVRQMLWGIYDDLPERLAYFAANVFYFSATLALCMAILLAARKGWLKARHLTVAVSAFIILDLWPVGWEFVKTMPVSAVDNTFFRETPQIKALEADKSGPFRVFSQVTNNELMYRGIQGLAGYHAAILTYYEKTLGQMSFVGNGILDMLNTKYLMLPKQKDFDFKDYPDENTRKALMEKYELIDDSDFYFYRNRTPLPRAWLVNKVFRPDDTEQALAIVADGRFRPADEAVVSGAVPSGFAVDPSTSLAGQKVEMEYFEPDKLKFAVSSPADSFMVISEVWYPGWKAYVDGKETPVIRTDYALRGVAMPRGGHTLEMAFRPGVYYAGCALSLSALAFIAGVAVFSAYGRKKGGEKGK